jgi:ATP-binding cassette, subfamily G (WHITE), member 5 (sterolin 1)
MVLDPQRLDNGYPFLYIVISLWTSFILAEQLTIFFLFFMRSKINVAVAVSYIICIMITLSSGTVRSYRGLTPFMQENTKATHTRYVSSLLHSAIFLSRRMNCIPKNGITCPSPKEFLYERLGRSDPNEVADMSIALAFAVGFAAFNMIIYLLPMPRCVRNKFKD